jgi:hypothetical protein
MSSNDPLVSHPLNPSLLVPASFARQMLESMESYAPKVVLPPSPLPTHMPPYIPTGVVDPLVSHPLNPSLLIPLSVCQRLVASGQLEIKAVLPPEPLPRHLPPRIPAPNADPLVAHPYNRNLMVPVSALKMVRAEEQQRQANLSRLSTTRSDNLQLDAALSFEAILVTECATPPRPESPTLRVESPHLGEEAQAPWVILSQAADVEPAAACMLAADVAAEASAEAADVAAADVDPVVAPWIVSPGALSEAPSAVVSITPENSPDSVRFSPDQDLGEYDSTDDLINSLLADNY